MKERTPFGQRLYEARTHAKLSQGQLARLAGVSQGNLGELEWHGNSSMATARLAMACGVRPEWLAEGKGEMVESDPWPFTLIDREVIAALDERQMGVVEGAMLNALASLERPNPEELAAFERSHLRPSTKRSPRKSA